MTEQHKKPIPVHNHLLTMVGQPFYEHEPSKDEVLEALLVAMSKFRGTTWCPTSIEGGYDLMLNQCPGHCGHVWKLNIQDHDIAAWLTNEINQRSHTK